MGDLRVKMLVPKLLVLCWLNEGNISLFSLSKVGNRINNLTILRRISEEINVWHIESAL